MKNTDVLNRQPFIDNVLNLLDMLSKDKRGCVFAIDGSWGSGKSFVLEQIEKQIEDVINEETYDDRYYLFHYNCWQYDYYPEPAVAIISAMMDKADETSKLRKKADATWEVAKKKLKEISGEFIKNKIGIDVVEIANSISDEEKKQGKKEREFDEWFSFKRTLDDSRKKIQEIAEEKTVLIVVDELDRCLPEYAIKVLERLHHLLEGLNNVLVLFAIDSKQLDYSIEKIYGRGTNAEKYLKKFISFKIKLDYGEVQDKIWDEHREYFSMFESKYFDDEPDVKNIVQNIFDKANFDIREKEKIIDLLLKIHQLLGIEKQDYSILLYEVLTAVFLCSCKKSNNQNNLSKLSNMDMSGFAGLSEEIGNELHDYIIEIEKGCYATTHYMGSRDFYECKSSMAVCLYILKELFLDKNTMGSEEANKYLKEIELCKKIEDYREIIV